jgi:DNA-binding response OmpR family regulator
MGAAVLLSLLAPLFRAALTGCADAARVTAQITMARILVVDDSPTIRKVVTGILERHGYETVAAADGQFALDALDDDDRPIDLVLLDFVMPRMNGFQFCRAIRGSDLYATLPVVLMSAKSDKIRDQFVEQTGAIDAISKPFDAQALVVAIENALRRMNQGRASQGRLPELDDLPVSSHSSPSLEPEQLRARAASHVGSRLATVLAPLLVRSEPGRNDKGGDEATNGSPLRSRDSLADAMATGLTREGLREIAAAARGIDFGEGAMALAGDIASIPIGAVLQMLQVESQTGVILVSNWKSEVTITMRAGLIDLVQSRGAGDEFRLGRFFVEEGLVTPDEIDALTRDQGRGRSDHARRRKSEARALEAEASAGLPGHARAAGDDDDARDGRSSSIPPPPPGASLTRLPGVTPPGGVARLLLGDALLQAGRVTAEQLKSALARQSSELIYEVLRWPRGHFEFRVQPSPPLAQRAQLGLPVASVVMEGFRRVDEWRLVEAGLGSFEAVLVRDPVAIDALPRHDDGALSRQERLVLDVIDGERTVREIIAASHMSSFDACRILMQFLEARLVRRRHG